MRILLEVLAFAGISLGMAFIANTAHADETAWYVANAKFACVNEFNAGAQIVLDQCYADADALTPAKIAQLIAAKNATYAAEQAREQMEQDISVENAREEFAACFRAAEQAGTDPVTCLN